MENKMMNLVVTNRFTMVGMLTFFSFLLFLGPRNANSIQNVACDSKTHAFELFQFSNICERSQFYFIYGAKIIPHPESMLI